MDRWNEHTSTFLTGEFTDISTAGVKAFANPVGGDLRRLQVAFAAAVTGTAVVTVGRADGEVLLTLTIDGAGTGIGSIHKAVQVEKKAISQGELVIVRTDGGSTNVVLAGFEVSVTRN